MRPERGRGRALRVFAGSMAMSLLVLIAPAAPAATPIKIGLASVFDFASEWMRDGAQFAVDEINRSGGVLGRPLRLISQVDPALGNQAVRQLLLGDRVDALIGPEVWTATQNNDQNIRNRRVINMLPLSPVGQTSVLRNPYVFRLIPYDAIQAEALVAYLSNFKGFRRFAVLYADDFLGREGIGQIRDRLKFAGLRPVYENTFNMGDVDMTQQVVGAQRSKADALIVWGLARETARIAKTARNLGWKVQIAGPVESVVGDFIDVAGSAAEGTVSVLPHKTINNWAPPGSFRANWFAKWYRRYGLKTFKNTKVPNLPIAQAVVYDSVKLVAEAMKIAGTTDGEAVRKVLESGRVFKLITADFTFSPDNHETYRADELWAFRISKGATNFDIDPRADKRKETEAWQLFAAGLLFDRKRGVAFIPLSLGTFDRGQRVPVGRLVWTAVSAKFVESIKVPYFGLPERRAEGKFAIVHLRLRNASGTTRKAPWSFVIDQSGNLSIPDPQAMAALWINGGPSARFFIFEPVPPGGTFEGDVVFDVEQDAMKLQVGVPDDFIFENYAMVRL
ncbi:MAG: ABC transporter substrate-binding protein [Actinomycetota bacterium]